MEKYKEELLMKSFSEYLLIERMIEKLWDVFKAKIPDIEHFVPDEKNAKVIFNVLNKYVFGNKLEDIKITVEHFDTNKHKNENGQFYVGRSHLHFYVDKVKNFHKTKMTDNDFRAMYINGGIIMTYYSKTSFDNFVSVMTHEMIHQLEILDPNSKYKIYLHILAKVYNDDFEYDAHSKFFTKEMDRINEKFRLNVKPTEDMNEDELKEMCDDKLDSLSGIATDESIKELTETEREDIIDLAKRMRKHLRNDGTTYIKATKDGVDLWIF